VRALAVLATRLAEMHRDAQNAGANLAHEMARMRFYADRPEVAGAYDAARVAAMAPSNGTSSVPPYEGPPAGPPNERTDDSDEPVPPGYPYS